MNMQLIQQFKKKYLKKVPVLKPGDNVKVHQRIKEGEKERIQVFEGLVIAINSGNGPDKTFTVRKVVGGIGVEKVFPLYSTNITKIQVTKSSDVRRAKLYYMRKRSGKSARLKERYLTEKDIVMEKHDLEEEKPEETAPEAVTEDSPKGTGDTDGGEERTSEATIEEKSEVAPEEKPEEKVPEVEPEVAPEETSEEKPEEKVPEVEPEVAPEETSEEKAEVEQEKKEE